ncbi:hypothetical protein [Luteipulveratus halotolerans]|uniref:hypothetical protein n=1 Tax=Luteipulveratus halotolerans TaxID=1631356 RepID=UPI0012FAA002|nr:hypothetical protein [Luteipulveratus halotolerans]
MGYRTKADEVAYQRDRSHGRPRYVSADPARQKLQRLLEADVSVRALARSSGLSAPALQAIANGERTKIQRRTATIVAQLALSGIYEQQPAGHVPKVGAVRRVHALMALGWTREQISQAGAPSVGRVINSPGSQITAQKWRQIRDVYDQLSMTPGPSPETRGWARSRGYPPPLAWDDGTIDDPQARPLLAPAAVGGEALDTVAVDRAIASTGVAANQTQAERVAVVRGMAAGGASDRRIGQHLDVVDRTILRTRQRYGIPSAQRTRKTGEEHDWDCQEARSVTSGSGAAGPGTVSPALSTTASAGGSAARRADLRPTVPDRAASTPRR